MSEDKTEDVASDEISRVADNGEQSLEQIREILFGSHSRDVDGRFDDLSQHVAQSLEGLRSLIREHFEALTLRLDNEVQRLGDELQKNQNENRATHAEFESKQQQSAKLLREQIGSLRETLLAEQSLRGESEKGLHDLRKQLTSEMESLRNQLQQSVDQVTRSNISRRTFGEILRELSARFDDNDSG